jgi:hypothetical protein
MNRSQNYDFESSELKTIPGAIFDSSPKLHLKKQLVIGAVSKLP